jgi:hypothetical protein
MIIFHVKRRIAIYAACVELAEENVSSTVSEYVSAERIRFMTFLRGGGD